MLNTFLSRFKIGYRLAALLVVFSILLLALGIQGLAALNNSSNDTERVSLEVEHVLVTQDLLSAVQGQLLGVANRTNIGELTWDDARNELQAFIQHFDTQWAFEIRSALVSKARFDLAREAVDESVRELKRLFDEEDRARLSLFVLNDMDYLLQPVIQVLRDEADAAKVTSLQTLADSQDQTAFSLTFTLALLLAGLIIAMLFGVLITRSITQPIGLITTTVNNVSDGHYEARTGVDGADEIGLLGSAFDQLLDERVAVLAENEQESEQLNDSVIGLLRAVSRLSRKDLTVKIPVTEDATGPVADALNQMTNETALVLANVRGVAAQVEQASTQVSQQADTVAKTAERQRQEVAATTDELAIASTQIQRVVSAAERASDAAQRTTDATGSAAQTVQGVLTDMDGIRDTIGDAGKRIKRLGERSQEISGIVDVINGIAERTTVLALNASMQAASAGEAGRGFSVVADEVQRLAENARNSTLEIATLVKNIVAETNDTMATMDQAIGKVVEGSRQTKAAGEQMEVTVSTTQTLVESVYEITQGTEQQAQIATALLQRAESIREETQNTGEALTEQLQQTQLLNQYAEQLVASVAVFTLPNSEKSVATLAVADAAAV